MKKVSIWIVVFVTFAVTIPNYVSARINWVRSDVLTTNYSNDFQLNIWVEVKDDVLTHSPDYVSSIEITDPNDQVYLIDNPGLYYWDDSSKDFNFTFRRTDIPGGAFLSGEYKIKVTDTKGNEITTSNTLKNADTPLPIPQIRIPDEGEVLMTTTPVIRWAIGTVHKRFRITIDRSYGGGSFWPVWDWRNSIWTMNKFIKIPKGVLKPGNSYRIRVEGRANYLVTSKRGRSDWRYFSIDSSAQ